MIRKFFVTYKKCIINTAICLFSLFLVCCSISVFNNFGKNNAAEYISENLPKCNIIQTSQRVEFQMATKNGKSSWFPSNYMAVATLFNSGRNNSMFFSYLDDSQTEWSLNDNPVEKAGIYGLGFGSIDYYPLSINIISGNIGLEDFDVTINHSHSTNDGWCIISNSYAKSLINAFSLSTIDDLIGLELKIPNTRTKYLTIKAICNDSTLITNYSNGFKYLISNYLSFSNRLADEKLIFRAYPDNKGMNFTIFKQLLYGTAWQVPFESNKNYFTLLSSPGNDWLCVDAERIYLGYSPNLSFIATLFTFSLAAIGFFLSHNNVLFKKGILTALLIVTIIYLSVFSLSFVVVDLFKIGGLHLIGRSLMSTIHEVLGYFVMEVTMIIFVIIRRKNDKIFFERKNYVEIDI